MMLSPNDDLDIPSPPPFLQHHMKFLKKICVCVCVCEEIVLTLTKFLSLDAWENGGAMAN